MTATESVTVIAETPELLELEAFYGPASKAPPPHLHPAHDERFTVLEGEMRVELGGEERTIREGDVLEVPRGTAHRMWNAGSVPARLRWENRPAGRVRQWFEAIDALQGTDNVNADGIPKTLPVAALLHDYRDVIRLAIPPDVVARPLLALLAPLGRRRLKGVR